jgi:hypothetical protein
MILYSFLLLVGVATLVALGNWRRGIFGFIVIALLQDPVRKLVPGAPAFLVMSTTPVLTAMIFQAFCLRSGIWADLRRNFPRLSKAIFLFVLAMLPPAALSATYGAGSWQVTLIGAFSYGSLLLSMLLGYLYPRREKDLTRLLTFYVICASIMLIGTPLEYFNIFPGWLALGTKAMDMVWLRYLPGVTVKMVAGFFRSPDVMGWHASTVTMFSLILALRSRGSARYAWIALAVWGVAGNIFCGRRKMIMMLPVFAGALSWVYWRLRNRLKTAIRLATIVSVLVLSIVGTVTIYTLFSPDETFMQYYTHNPGDIYKQADAHGIGEVTETFRQSGWFGEGLGSATPGIHNLSVERPRTWQEGGIARIAVELGAPGLLLFFYLGYSLLRSILDVMFKRSDCNSPAFTIYVGLFAIMVANGCAFVVSGQIFGDPFIISFFSFLIGITLSGERISLGAQGGVLQQAGRTRYGNPPFARQFASLQTENFSDEVPCADVDTAASVRDRSPSA